MRKKAVTPTAAYYMRAYVSRSVLACVDTGDFWFFLGGCGGGLVVWYLVFFFFLLAVVVTICDCCYFRFIITNTHTNKPLPPTTN